MKYKSIISLILIISLFVNAQTTEHRALVISGDTPASAKAKVEQAIASGDTLEGLWGLQEALREGSRAYDEFWNDNFLMWEILYNKDWADSVIHVFYGYGNDYQTGNPFYQASKYFLPKITDCGAYRDSILGFLSDLRYGQPNAMDGDDILFFWVISHGSADRFATIDSMIYADELADSTFQIYAKKRIFWMQQCRSGSFIDDLDNMRNLILTACRTDQYAWGADNKDYDHNGDSLLPAIENEYDSLTQKQYHHGEFDFHVMNAVRQKKIYPYDNPPPVITADSNNNRGTSTLETFNYLCYNNSIYQMWGLETPQFSDLGGIGSSTYLEWDDLLSPAVPNGFTYRYKRETDYDWGIKLQWEDNDEVDMSGFYLYKNNILFDSTYKDTTYIDYDIDNYKGDTVQYSLSAFDLRDRESPQTNLSFTIPITISSTSSSTGNNNARRLLSYEHSIYLLYRSNNKVYCIISDDNGSTWGAPELVSDTSYIAKAPAGGVTEGGKIVAVWVRGNDKLMFSVRDNGVWSDPFEISLLLPHLGLQIHSLRNPGVAATEDICHIFINGIWRDREEGSRYQTKWLYGEFPIDDPYPKWEVVESEEGMINSSPTITLKNNTPLLAYDKEDEIIYTQRIKEDWYKWNISDSPDGFSRKPNIDYLNGYANLVWVEDSIGVPIIECVSIVPATDSNLNYQPIPFKDRPFYADEPFVITNQWLYWEEEVSGRYEIKRSCYDENTFSWDYPEDVSEISWSDALYPQTIYYRPRKDDLYELYRVIASVWSEGETPDIGIQERDEQISDFRFASSNLGQSFSSPYQIQREGHINYSNGSKPFQMVDYHPQELIYKIDGLDPDLRYRLKLGLFQRSDAKWKEKIEVDGTSLGETWLNSDGIVWFESEIPYVHTQDGEITVKVIKVTGNYAVCGALYLYEYAEKGVKGADSPETSPIPTQYELYIKPIAYGKMNLEFGLPEECKVELRIYDVTGRCVRTAIDRLIEAGIHKVNIEGLSAGVYFYNFKAGKENYRGKILNIR